MHYLSRFTESSSERIRSIVDLHWNFIGNWVHLLAGACYPFPEVMKSLSEPMCVFPVEGLPGERFFPGTNVMDKVENRAELLLRSLFSLDEDYRATIQPHSGTQANQIVFNTVLNSNDKVLSLSPRDGGHISHKVLIGRRNKVFFYPLGNGDTIDYESLEKIAMTERPKLIIAGGSACPREIGFVKIGKIASRSGAFFHADVSHTATLIAGKVHQSVFPYADFVSFNMVKNLRGPNGGVLIYRKKLHKKVNKALFPDTQGGPNENTMFAKLIALEKLSDMDIEKYAKRMVEIARLIAKTLQERKIKIVTNGTDSHQVLINLKNSHLTGAEAEKICEKHRVLLNRNLISDDPQKPWITSGVRIGTSCITILEYSNTDVERLAHWIADHLTNVKVINPLALINELTNKYNKKLLPPN